MQLFTQDYNLASHITHFGCVNFLHKRQNPQFKVDSERHIFEKLFKVIFFTRRVFARPQVVIIFF